MRHLWLAVLPLMAPAQVRAQAGCPCAVDSDCAARDARCVDECCTLGRSHPLFPSQNDLDAIELLSPINLGSLSSTPDFRWAPTLGADLVAVVIFRRLPRSQGDRITNFGDNALWLWHSRLDGVDAASGRARFEDGKAIDIDPAEVIDVENLSDAPAEPLPDGVYYWAAWAWEEDAPSVALSHRSEIRTFTVGPESLTGADCDQCESVAEVEKVRSHDGYCYCAISCASDVDCFGGDSCDLTPIADHGFVFGVCHAPGAGDCDCGQDEGCEDGWSVCYSRGAEDAAGCSAVVVGSKSYPYWLLIGLLLVAMAGRNRRRRHP